jgi:toxin ParE1/3/4
LPDLVILPAARVDLLDIGDFIALDNPERALSLLSELERTMRMAAERPGSFPARDDLHLGLRVARHGRYLIFFLEVSDEVQVVRVLHGARDLPSALAP